MRRCVAAVLALSLAGAGCATSGGSASSDGSNDRTSTTRPSTSTTSAGTTTTADSVAPLPDDVPDATFSGLGDPRIDVAHYDVRVRAKPGAEPISGSVRMQLRPTTTVPLTSFTLDLRGPKVSRVTVDGSDATATTRGGEVTITPDEPLEPGAESEVRIDYAGTPDQTEFPGWGMPVGWQVDDEDGWFTMSEPNGTATWVPVNDHLSDKATWTLTVDVPRGLTAVGNGTMSAGSPKALSDGWQRWRWTEVQPMASYLVLVAIGRYDLVRSRRGDVSTVRAFPTSMPKGDRKGFEDLEEILDYYGTQFGPYPNDDAGAIVVPTDLGLALESQTRPLFGIDGVEDGGVPALPHELAHQWFGDAVTPTTWTDVWLNEGFATYADWMWEDHIGGRAIDDQAARTSRSLADQQRAVRDPRSAGTFSPAVYEGGALALHALRQTVGDDAFFRIVKRWVRTYRGRNASTADLVEIASDEAGRDLTGFFADWLDHAPQPALPR